MARPASDLPNDVTVYLVEEDFGQLGRAYLETDTAEADRETIVRNFISGQYEDARRVVAFNTGEGWSRDVSEEIAYDVLDRAYDSDTTLSAGAKRFIDRHVTTGEKRPPAPSVLREQDKTARKKGLDRIDFAGPVPQYWRDGRQDTRARHQGWRRKAEGGPRRARGSRGCRRSMEQASGHRPRHAVVAHYAGRAACRHAVARRLLPRLWNELRD
jgi:hypothetical protein